MTESFLPNGLYAIVVERVTKVAGRGDVELIKIAMGPLLHDRPGLAERLAFLEPCPCSGRMTDDQVKHCLGVDGDLWPKLIYGPALLAAIEGSVAANLEKANKRLPKALT